VLLLVSGETRSVRARKDSKRLGHLLTPKNGNSIDALLATGLPVACDNSAFGTFDEAAFRRMLGKVRGKPVLFVCAPDVVGDAATTLALFDAWEPVIRGFGLPVALVGQDGLEDLAVPWGRMDAFFIGGGTGWKLGGAAAGLAREAKARGLWVHGGRVNTKKRFRHMAEIGCDSVDGSGFSRWPDARIPMAERWLEEIERQTTLALAA
jgi:hypothetical protein